MDFLNGYKRTPTKFEWCGTTVWLVKLTQADHESIFQTDTSQPADDADDKQRVRNFHIELIARSLTNEQGALVAASDEAAEYFRTSVAFDDVVSLGKLSMRHSGYQVADEPEKKS